MTNPLRVSCSLLLVFILATLPVDAQTDTTSSFEAPGNSVIEFEKPDRSYRRFARQSAIPVTLIGLGVLTRGNRGSVQTQREFQNVFPEFFSRADYGLMVLPYAQLIALNLLQLPCRDDFINTSLIILKSEVLMLGMVYAMKLTTDTERPDGSNRQSFPSAHTAQAFLAATIVNEEYKARSHWPGIGAYTIAVGVGTMRMMSNRHWLSDVLAGAGIGMLSGRIVYFTHQYRWGRNDMCLVPIPMPGGAGLHFSYAF